MAKWRISLRTVFGAIGLLGIVLGWWVNGVSKQRQIVARVRELGGDLYYDWEYEGRRSAPVGPFGAYRAVRQWIGPDAVDRIAILDLGLDRGHTRVVATEDDVIGLLDRYSFQALYLSETGISDRTLRAIGRQWQCEVVKIAGTRVTNDGIEHLRGMSKLRELDISRTTLSDAPLQSIAKCSGLEELSLEDTAVTDDGIAALHSLSDLKFCRATGTRVSIKGANKLREACPKCQVEFSEGAWSRVLPPRDFRDRGP